jgi:methyl-accepting chemotaxis protein
MKIRTRLIITYLLVALLPLFFVSWISYTHAKDALIAERLLALESTTELKITAINEYFSNFSKEITVTKERSIVREYLSAIALLENKPNDTEYKRLREEMDAQVNTLLLTQTDMEALFFVSPDGIIAYSSKKDFEQKTIGAVFPVLGDMAFQNGKSGIFLSDIFYDQANNARDFIESAPLYNLSGNFVGVIIFQVKTERLFALIQNATGMGKTGETYVVQQVSNSTNGDNLRPYDPKGDSILFINTSRSTPKVAFNRVVRFGDFGELPVQEAVQGKEGAGISTDYRGKEVLAVWRYLPAYKWGFVTKIDMSEVLSPVYALASTVALFSFAIILIVLFFALIFANTISSPLHKLEESIKKIKRGNLNVKVSLSRSDEIGDLSRSFSEMVEITKQTQSDIKKQVDDKTAELSEKNKDLDEQKNAILSVLSDVEKEKDKSESLAKESKKFQLAVDNASEMVVITDPEGVIIYGNKAVKKITGYSSE